MYVCMYVCKEKIKKIYFVWKTNYLWLEAMIKLGTSQNKTCLKLD